MSEKPTIVVYLGKGRPGLDLMLEALYRAPIDAHVDAYRYHLASKDRRLPMVRKPGDGKAFRAYPKMLDR